LLPIYDAVGRLKSQQHWQTDVIAGWIGYNDLQSKGYRWCRLRGAILTIRRRYPIQGTYYRHQGTPTTTIQHGT
jgi:hypothetical protein